MSVASALTNLAEQLRFYLNTDKRFKLDEMPFEIAGVFHVGHTEGEASGIVQGEYNEYVRFWNDYQQNGNRVQYSYAFAGFGWTDATCKPIYPLQGKEGSPLNINYAFYYNTGITETPLIVSTENVAWTGTFTNANNIEKIRVSGVIGVDFNIKNLSKITAQSIYDVVKCLKGGATKTITFNAAAKNAFYTQSYIDDSGIPVINSAKYSSAEQAWVALEALKPTWTFVV